MAKDNNRNLVRFEFTFKYDIWYAYIEMDKSKNPIWDSELSFMHTNKKYKCEVDLLKKQLIIIGEKPVLIGYYDDKEYELKKIRIPKYTLLNLGSRKGILKKGEIKM